MEITQMVAPLVSNKALVEALKAFIRDSFLNNKLRELVQYVSYCTCLQAILR